MQDWERAHLGVARDAIARLRRQLDMIVRMEARDGTVWVGVGPRPGEDELELAAWALQQIAGGQP